ncbi:hypothetical protein EPA93_02470 [Ktedonosporobacter rubrisoli]|uniref:Uncharacterized protein n=1 Tax=Ktedonosporobacter rubrisoli TaxID=2509675 RepID=A0A4P6JIL2_KTERU|nr:hypothetical protein [Ktedonosporobacter rubrisoli]QBD74914.1 hypothetical protein EPA93_02470 [Ktedonosporobacter rubrisoli]
MLDPTKVIHTARQGHYPADWQVFPSKSRLGCAIGIAIFLLCFGIVFGSSLGIAVTSGLEISSFRLETFNIASPHIDGPGLVAALVVAGLFLLAAVWIVRGSLLEGHSLLVLLPEGVVECYRGQKDKIAHLSFNMVQKMDMDKQITVRGDTEDRTSSSTDYWFNVYYRENRYVKWNIHDCYGDPIVIGGNIIAAFEHYQRQQMQQK